MSGAQILEEVKESKGTDIPIDNWWYFLWYSDYNKEINKDDDDVDITDPLENFWDFIIKLLLYKVNNLIRRGLEKDYIPISEKIPGIKGKLLFNPSIKSGALFTNQAICQFDEYTPNILSNQLIKSTLYRLMIKHNTNKELAKKIKYNFYKLGGIDLIDVSKKKFNTVRIHANNLSYRRVLGICKFILYYLPDQGDGDEEFEFAKLPELNQNGIFEDYIRKFFKNNAKGAKVSKGKPDDIFYWNEDEAKKAKKAKKRLPTLVPKMETDVNIRFDANFTIVECKLGYGGQLIGNKYHTKHLFQLFSYLEAAKVKYKEEVSLQGVLLYAKASNEVPNNDDLIYLQSHPVKIRSINLGQSWQGIEADLKTLYDEIYNNFNITYAE